MAIECTKEGVKFSCNGDIGSGAVTLRSHTSVEKPSQNIEIALSEPVALTFSLKYLVNFCKASALSDQVKLCLSNEVPLLVEYGLQAQSHLRFYLAPKVSLFVLLLHTVQCTDIVSRSGMRSRANNPQRKHIHSNELHAVQQCRTACQDAIIRQAIYTLNVFVMEPLSCLTDDKCPLMLTSNTSTQSPQLRMDPLNRYIHVHQECLIMPPPLPFRILYYDLLFNCRVCGVLSEGHFTARVTFAL